MEKIFEQVLLYDFYGELLTPHQRAIYEDSVYNDMSLGEIAEEHGISRQGVHDLIRRCDRLLQDYESKLQLVGRFTRAREKLGEIMDLTADAGFTEADPTRTCGPAVQELCGRMARIRALSQELIKEW